MSTAAANHSRLFLRHARLIGGLTLLSRVAGLVRQSAAGHYLGTGVVASAFTVAFTIPNLFRKLLGEGALSQAFIPLYADAVERGRTPGGQTPTRFAGDSVKLLVMILAVITLVGEGMIGLLIWWNRASDRVDHLMMLKLAAVMLPYVMLVCGGALLSAILQVHKRFGLPAFAPVLLNVVHIIVLVAGAWALGLTGRDTVDTQTIERQSQLAYALAAAVLVAGGLQVVVLLPALRQVGFRPGGGWRCWTPDTKKMLRLSVPVGVGAMVLQTSVLLDKAISYGLMQGRDKSGEIVTQFVLFGQSIDYPMVLGATQRLDFAQLMYQFPLGIFAIAVATAIFPALAAAAGDVDRSRFRAITRVGVVTTLWEGVPASVGLMLVAGPAVRLLFQHGHVTPADADLIIQSTRYYAAGVWAYALLMIVTRAFFARQNTRVPLVASLLNIVVNLLIELPLVWMIGEAGMAVGTLVSFSLQAIVMTWLLHRQTGEILTAELWRPVGQIVLATLVMLVACLGVMYSPLYPTGESRAVWLVQLLLVTLVGGGTYLLAGRALRLPSMFPGGVRDSVR